MPFGTDWKEQGFFRFWSNEYETLGDRLRILSDGTVSLIYTRLPERMWSARKASWRWSVTQSVRATDLTRKGDDDRNIAMYFVFADGDLAPRLAKRSARRLLRNKNVRALVYVWGGDYERNAVIFNPYGPERLGTVALRRAATGDYLESVDLAADFRRVFGAEAGALLGIGITADSDDTDGRIEAVIQGLELE